MRSPARAIAWEIRRRHRIGFSVLAGYVLLIGIVKLLLSVTGTGTRVESPEQFGLFVMGPVSAILTYLITVFAFGLTGDIAARHSIYPARLYTLPVTTTALATWPMIYGMTTIAGLWLLARWLAPWPADFDVPVVWPAVLGAAFLGWTQAVTWMPYGLRGVRVVLFVLSLSILDVAAIFAIEHKVSEGVMIGGLVPLLPLAWVTARIAVARARRGDVPDWNGLLRIARWRSASRRAGPFASPHSAQAWIEWRTQGWSLPVLVAMVLPFELLVLFAAGDSAVLVFAILVGALLTPPFMAAFTLAGMRNAGARAAEPWGIGPFVAARPLTTGHLLEAKLRMTVRSTLLAWIVVVVAVPIGLWWSGTMGVVSDRMAALAYVIGTPRAVVFAMLVVAAAVLATWRQFAQALYVGLWGRPWLVRTSLGVALVAVIAVGPLLVWVLEDRDARSALWDALRWFPAVLVAVRTAVAAWIVTRLWDSRLLGDRALVLGAFLWIGCVLAVYGVLAWLVWSPHIPRYLLVLLATLAIPFVRVAAAPLALDASRHR